MAAQRTFAALVAASALNAIAPLIALPALAQGVSHDAWAAVAVGQSVGGVAAVLAAWGWPIGGPTFAAMETSDSSRIALLRESIASRTLMLIAILPIVSIAAFAISPAARWLAAATAAAACAASLSCAWYFIGVGDTRRLILLDTLPRFALGIVAAALIWTGFGPYMYPLFLALGYVLTLLVPIRVVTRVWGMPRSYFNPREIRRSLGKSRALGVTQAMSSFYINGPTALVAVVAPGTVAEFAALHRVYLFALQASAPVGQFFSGWIPRERSELLQRSCRALTIQSVLGLVAIPLTIVIGPLMASALFGAALSSSLDIWIVIGFAHGAVLVSRAFANSRLLPARKTRVLAISASAGALVGAALLTVLTPQFGTGGAAAAVLTAEAVVLVVQCVGARGTPRILRRLGAEVQADQSETMSGGFQ